LLQIEALDQDRGLRQQIVTITKRTSIADVGKRWQLMKLELDENTADKEERLPVPSDGSSYRPSRGNTSARPYMSSYVSLSQLSAPASSTTGGDDDDEIDQGWSNFRPKTYSIYSSGKP